MTKKSLVPSPYLAQTGPLSGTVAQIPSQFLVHPIPIMGTKGARCGSALCPKTGHPYLPSTNTKKIHELQIRNRFALLRGLTRGLAVDMHTVSMQSIECSRRHAVIILLVDRLRAFNGDALSLLPRSLGEMWRADITAWLETHPSRPSNERAVQ